MNIRWTLIVSPPSALLIINFPVTTFFTYIGQTQGRHPEFQCSYNIKLYGIHGLSVLFTWISSWSDDLWNEKEIVWTSLLHWVCIGGKGQNSNGTYSHLERGRWGPHNNDEIPLGRHGEGSSIPRVVSVPELGFSSESWSFLFFVLHGCRLYQRDVLSFLLFSSATSEVGIRGHGLLERHTIFSVTFFLMEHGTKSCKSQSVSGFFSAHLRVFWQCSSLTK